MAKRLLCILLCIAAQFGCSDDTDSNDTDDICQEDCTSPSCGDGVVDEGEACDDGNSDDGDGCRNNCTVPACGDGVLDNDEACDDGNLVDDDACRNTCVLPLCGDGVLDPLEECDEGSDNSDEPDAACRTNCRVPRCGDGVVDASAGEVCDDGNLVRGDGCSPDCLSDETCGNGVLDAGEQCDDGNYLSNDGCASDCVIETPQWTQFVNAPASVSSEFYVQVFDANRGQLLRFTRIGTNVLDSRGWRQASQETPLAIYVNAVCANDVGRATVVCYAFDGVAGRGATYTWDGVGWTTATQDNPPAPRAPGAFVYDPVRQRVVMFGGNTGDPTFEAPVHYDDTWEWDGARWNEVETPTTPSGFDGEAAFHPVMGEVVLLVQNAVEGEVDDTYTYDGVDWTKVSDTAPAALSDRFRWEPTTQELVLESTEGNFAFDGSAWVETNTPSRNPRNEYWNGSEYATTTPTVPTPQHSELSYTSAAYIPTSGQIMIAGGGVGLSPAPLNVVPETQQTRLYGSSGWSYGPTSPTSMHPGLAYDAKTNELMLVDDGTFLWDGTEWTSFSGSAWNYVSIAWDPNLEAIVRFGGMSGQFVYDVQGDPPPPFLAEGTQYWDGSNWMPVDVAEPPARRWLANMLWYPPSGDVVLMGGVGITGGRCCDVLYTAWNFDGSTSTWAADERSSISRRVWNEVIYDPHRASLLEFGGYVQSRWFTQMFEKRGDGDFQPIAAEGPEVRFPAMAFHALHRRTTLFDGHDIWEFGYGPVREMCLTGLDGDNDGLVGCDDPDCWGYCNPECPPGAMCPADADRCGDGICNPSLETSRLCPADCGEPTAVCGDFLCDSGESAEMCPGDCP